MERVFDCDPKKRSWLLAERGFDVRDMAAVFADPKCLDFVDRRRDYGEERRVTIGQALGRVFTVVYTMRGPVTWIITAWPASRKEREHYAAR
ncbi:MAG: BrnT family toxin [Rhodoplanes sp.]|uniref:BrnT family toxin n=1 Tax=Rhodoplanes sp. TaxID=1968906 RepID=UPI0017B55194|nr:BrnT family toxin [Rhodoplanes sp.]NVO17431.1 BrnT family toxin [Rhodoplanes sp.]